jgi:hypothetical protein
MAGESSSVACPPSSRLATPIEALMVVLKRAASPVNFSNPVALENASQPPAKRATSVAPSTASSVLPNATPTELATDPDVVTLTRNAPISTAGVNRSPPSSSAASAMPVGNQTAAALG